ncbi:ankyrin-3-like isoform X2 [Phymastichus coffea]|uniref:ankyrin-3-like isoform X2 n=1 Tax=Phymastichus coffea TaxID=108790 RepID=UPI00273CB576|nr:ankyrin-3-like isoform X2 [Phymastichus coffea]
MVFSMIDGEPRFNEALLDYVQNGSIRVLESFFRNEHPDASDSSGKTLLHYAAKSNNVSMTQHLIDSNYEVDARDHYGNSPLMLAVQSDSVDTARLLIRYNASVYFRDARGRSILPHRAKYKFRKNILLDVSESELLNKYRELVKIILERVRRDCWHNEQLLISRLTEINCSLVKAIYLGDANVTRLMLEYGRSVDERELETNETALHEAVKLGDFQNVKVLLEYGADVGAQNEDGLSPIYLYNQLSKDTDQKIKILRTLIEHGALLAPTPEKCMTPSQFILQNGKLWAINTLMQYDFEWDPHCSLLALVSNNDPDALEAVRGSGLELNATANPIKMPVLSFAATFGPLKKVQFLLESGADPNVVSEDGQTPLTSAFSYTFGQRKEHLPIVCLMLQHGADAQYSFQDGRTVFDVAAQQCHENLLEPVIAHLAMRESLGEAITDAIRSKIYSRDTFKAQFERCEQQIRMLKNTSVHETVTMYKLLTESQSKITRYARNKEFAPRFRKQLKNLTLEPYYSICLRKRVGKAIHLAQLNEQAVIVMNKLFRYRIKNYHEILSEIVDYFNCDQLKTVCSVYSLQESEPFHLDNLFVQF